jgi:hypothetical protein
MAMAMLPLSLLMLVLLRVLVELAAPCCRLLAQWAGRWRNGRIRCLAPPRPALKPPKACILSARGAQR